MLIGYARISKADGSQSLDLQRDALRQAGVSDDAIYEDQASGQREDRVDDVHRRGGMMARDLSVRVDTMRTVPETDDRLHVHFKNSQSAKGTEAPPR